MLAASLYWGALLALGIPAQVEASWTWLQVALVGFAYPVLEETVFRGLLQPALRQQFDVQFCGLSAANIVTTAIFAVYHYPNHGIAHAALVVVPSLYLGYVMDRTSKLGLCIFLHALFNLGNLAVWNRWDQWLS